MALLLFLVSFADGKPRVEYVQLAWSTTLKVLICLILCSVADVAKTLLAKLLSSHFHKRAHFDKMQDALNKVLHGICAVLLDLHSNGLMAEKAKCSSEGLQQKLQLSVL